MESLLRLIKKFVPNTIFRKTQPAYHYVLAFLSALLYRFPSRKLTVIGVTGTKGKSTVAELVSAILEEAGYTTALQTTIRFKIGEKTTRNLYKMTMPGRFFLQRFLRKAANARATHAVIEMTSEGAKQFRHTFVELDSLIFTNLSPEHIESHGSYEAYRSAKLSIAEKLAASKKPKHLLIVNGDDAEAVHFLNIESVEKHTYRLTDAEPFTERDNGMNFTWSGETVRSRLLGTFNISNMLAAATWAKAYGIEPSLIKSAFEKCNGVPGRLEEVSISKDQPFRVFVDYAHTPDSLKAVYETFKSLGKSPTHLICAFGSTGGGRDAWKRPVMGSIAETYCDHIILTDDDSYDEDTEAIIREIQKGIKEKPSEAIVDRRRAIRRALELAYEESKKSPLTTGAERRKIVVLLTGKGTDPYLMGLHGSKLPWDDRKIAEEELEKLLRNSS